MRIIADSSVWIDLLRAVPSLHAEWLRAALRHKEPLTVPGLIAAEVLQGMKSEADANRLASLFEDFPPAPALTYADHVDAARLWRRCRAKGVTVRSTVDCLIAQLAIRHRLILVSKDRDFEGIAKVAPLRLLTVRAH